MLDSILKWSRWILPLWVCGWAVGAGADSARIFGSQKLLDSLWTPDQLVANPAERIVVPHFSDGLADRPDGYLEMCLTPRPPVAPALRNSIRSVRIGDSRKWVALTFDLCEGNGEQSGYDGEIVDFLRREGIKATFYAGGKWMRSHPDRALQLMVDPLFEIGNHSWSHSNLRLRSGETIRKEVRWAEMEYEYLWDQLAKMAHQYGLGAEMERIPRTLRTFRFPYGACNREALEFLAAEGLPAVQWEVVSGDSAIGQDAETITRLILKRTRPGSIIIDHANGRGWKTAEALHKFIPRLREQGYEFVTISELLEVGEPIASEECYEMRPGDNARYDEKKSAP